MDNKAKDIIILVLCAGILIILASYHSMFRTTRSYVYIPPTSEIYILLERPYVLDFQRWKYLVPFISTSYTSIDCVQRLGTLGEIRAENEKTIQDIMDEALTVDLQKWTYLDAKLFFPRGQIDNEMIPEDWKTFLEKENIAMSDLSLADMVLMTDSVDVKEWDPDVEVMTLRDVVFFQDHAAQALSENLRLPNECF